MRKKLISLIIFGIAFGFVEASVVFYLRGLLNYGPNYPLGDVRVLLNLGFMKFVSTKSMLLGSYALTRAEVIREVATILILLTVADLAVKTNRQRLGAFLIAFSMWDLFYYVFLKFLAGWPISLFDTDIYFLIPVASIGPVITPIVIFLILFAVGVKLYSVKKEQT
jgi:hypothetical protein